jgi:hypothetical protein
MRFVPAFLLTGCLALVVTASCLPWGYLALPWEWARGKETYDDGWQEPLNLGRQSVPNWLVAASVGVATVLAWLRAARVVKIPRLLLLLSGYPVGVEPPGGRDGTPASAAADPPYRVIPAGG